MNATIVLPEIDRDILCDELRRLTRCIFIAHPEKGDEGGGVLGGPDGYGANIETDVFVMRMFRYDEDCTCDQDGPEGACSRECAFSLNFEHKPSGFALRWYKYIGRGMELHGNCADAARMVDECVASLGVS